MAAIGDRPAAKITTSEIEELLRDVSKTGASPSTVNKYLARIAAVFNYGMRESTFKLPSNPVTSADKRREPHPGALVYYSPEEVEALARALEDGKHRDRNRPAANDQERAEDRQDAEVVRVAAYSGLRQGELLALRWRDVDFAGHALTISRAMSAGVEGATKSGKVRRVTMPDQAAAALDRLSRREDFTGDDELVFCNVLGRSLDGSALRRRFKRARDAAGLRPLRLHDLRHTYRSLLAAAGVDLVTIQAAMGHDALSTTSRYLHAKPASEQAEIFTRAFSTSMAKPRKRTRAEPLEHVLSTLAVRLSERCDATSGLRGSDGAIGALDVALRAPNKKRLLLVDATRGGAFDGALAGPCVVACVCCAGGRDCRVPGRIEGQ